MKFARSLQARLALTIGGGVAVLWVAASLITANLVSHEIDEVFDSALEETAQRILPLAIQEVFERDENSVEQLINPLRTREEFLTYVVRNAEGRVLLRSHDAKIANFPAFKQNGFIQTDTHRLYNDSALGGSFTITIAEPIAHRTEVARETFMALGLPLLILLPLTLGGIWILVQVMLRPVQKFRTALSSRGGHDLTPVDPTDLPDEIGPVAEAVNTLLSRLQRTLDAERSFASNAAHELRTPVAGALAQTQRLITETGEPATRKRAQDIEIALKRLNRLSEKLMQLARAEGAKLHADAPYDLRQVLRIVAEDMGQAQAGEQIELSLPDQPVLSNIDADAFAILLRNLLENALRHGTKDAPVRITLTPDSMLRVVNAGPVIAPEILRDLTQRFHRGNTSAKGSGLGLSIVYTIMRGIGGKLDIRSPATDREDGFEVVVHL